MKKLSNYSAILWDFNGTLFDDVDAGIASVNTLLAARGLPTIPDREYYREVFGFPVIGYYEKLGFDFKKESFDNVAVEWINEYNRNSASSGLCAGASELLEYFKRAGIRQYVISATEKTMLERQLGDIGISEYFDDVYGLGNIHAGSKALIAGAWRDLHRNDTALFIGDTTHDADVAEHIGADCVLCAAGHQSRAILETCNCCGVIDRLEDIFAIPQK